MSRKELSAEIWRAADIMRRDDGTNGINEYIEQISWMFFLKVFEDLEIRFETSAKLENKKYLRLISKDYSWSKWTNMNTTEIIDYVDTKLFPYLGKVSGTPEQDTIGIIFKEVRRNKMKSASNFKDVIDIINKINFNDEEDSHILSLFYEDLLVKLGRESGIAGEFYTPRPIVKLIVKLIDPKLNQKDKKNTRMLDPFSGSCGFLVESFKHMMKGKPNAKDVPIIQHTFHGYEKKSLPYLVGLMNCILHGLITPNSIRRNSLNDNILKFGPDDKFDFILTNPPFGGTENKQIQQNFPVKSSSTELLALQQIMRRLKTAGKCGIVLPEGLLYGGDSNAKVKKELLENYNVHTIISLPAGVFANVTASGQGPKTYLLFFDKGKPTTKIWYYKVTPPQGKKYSKSNSIKDEDLEDCYLKWKEQNISSSSWFVDIKSIQEQEYDLTENIKKENKKSSFEKPEILLKKISDMSISINNDLESLKTKLEKYE